MKIEIGDFIRTKSGKIRKVKCIVAQYYVTDKLNVSDNNQFTSDEIASHSQNLIDLIEIKDVVEYRELSPFTHNLGTRFHEKYITDIHDEEELKNFKDEVSNNKIKLLSVATKQQFEQMKYIVEE